MSCIPQIFEEPLGLAGKWGPIVREWLELLLPTDAHLRCKGRVFVLITAIGGGDTSTASPRGSFGSSTSSSNESSTRSCDGRRGAWSAAWPPLRRVRVTDFSDRGDLLDALMASVNLALS